MTLFKLKIIGGLLFQLLTSERQIQF